MRQMSIPMCIASIPPGESFARFSLTPPGDIQGPEFGVKFEFSYYFISTILFVREKLFPGSSTPDASRR